MTKYFVLDTNVLLKDPEAIYKFEDNHVIIPMIVVEELDNAKKIQDEVGRNARKVSRYLDELRQEGKLTDGISIYPGTIKVVSLDIYSGLKLPLECQDLNKADNIIIATALSVKNSVEEECILVSCDINVRIKGDACGLKCEDYDSENKSGNDEELFSGTRSINVDLDFINNFYNKRGVSLTDEEVEEKNWHPNEFVIFKQKNGSGSAIGRFHSELKSVREVPQYKDVFGIKAKNVEQQFALDLLFDDRIKLVTLVGKAGTGKTLLAIAAGLRKVIEDGAYDKLVVTKPVQPVGKDIGFMPGPQPLDAKILTPNGWTTMGELKVGDFVIARDGKPTKVLNIFPKGKKLVYKITTDDNLSTECCEDHLWFTQTYEEFKRKKAGQVRSTKDIMATLVNKNYSKNKLNHYLPRNEKVEFNSTKLPLSPYTLGVLLGDGSISNNISIINTDNELFERVNSELSLINCELSGTSMQRYIRANKIKNNKPSKKVKITNLQTNEVVIYSGVKEAGEKLKINKTTINSRCLSLSEIDGYKYEFLQNKYRWQNPIKNILSDLGLYKKGALEKFIPKNYIYNSSIEDRISLLQGLMDTDGTIKENGEMSFCTISNQLALDVIELVRTLGGTANLRSRNRVGKKSIINGREVKTNYICFEFNINLPYDINPFYINRKAFKVKNRNMMQSRIKSVEISGYKEVQCILVDHPEHLYITDDFIVTHNTKEEKMQPWIAPIKDNLDFLCGNKTNSKLQKSKKSKDNNQSSKPWNYSDRWFEEGLIEVEAVTFLRGRSIANTFMIIDEAQNLSLHELKTILTRAGEGTKIVLTGDIQQIDSNFLDFYNNGLSHAVEKFKDYSIAGHVYMTKGERSELATLASEIL